MKIYHIVRTPTWIPPPWRQATVQSGGGQMLHEISVDDKENFPKEQVQRFKDDDEFYRRFVKGIEKDTSGGFRMVRRPRPPSLPFEKNQKTKNASPSANAGLFCR